MSTARILIRQGTETYRFMRFKTSSDGSLIILVDRDPRPTRGGMSGSFDPLSSKPIVFTATDVDSDRPLPSFKFSAHTSGVVHHYSDDQRMETIHIEPLYALTRLSSIAIISIPSVVRLDMFNNSKHTHDAEAVLEFPEDVLERLTFVIELGPAPQEPRSFGVGLNYELYSVVVRAVPTPSLPPEVSEHFIAAMGDSGVRPSVDKASAELSFYQRIHGDGMLIFREDKSGAYVAMAAVPMTTPPKLAIAFNRPDLQIEIIPFEESKEPTHKVRFWICDSAGHNKTEDFREYITSATLDSRL